MTPEQFCFWLHGFFELNGTDDLTGAQSKMVREHLDFVFTKVTQPLDTSTSKRDVRRERDITNAIQQTKRIC